MSQLSQEIINMIDTFIENDSTVLYGKWSGVGGSISSISFEFCEDGSYVYYNRMTGKRTVGKFILEGNIINCITVGTKYEYFLYKNNLVLASAPDWTPDVFTKTYN